MAVGAYPGTFNPPTVAHVAIAEAARLQAHLDRVDLVLSYDPLGKKTDQAGSASLSDRLAALEQIAGARSWLSVRTTDSRLIADIAAGYDAVILGADKWLQVIDPTWYGGSVERRDAAVAGLPRLIVAPRAGHPIPGPLPPDSILLSIEDTLSEVSSTAVRAGRIEWLAPGAGATLPAMPQDPPSR